MMKMIKYEEYDIYREIKSEKQCLLDSLRRTLNALVNLNVKAALFNHDNKQLRKYRKDGRLRLYKSNIDFFKLPSVAAIKFYSMHTNWLNDSYNAWCNNKYWFINNKHLTVQVQELDDDIAYTEERIELNNKIIKHLNINNKVISANIYEQDSVCVELKVRTDSLSKCLQDLGTQRFIRTTLDSFNKIINANEIKHQQQLLHNVTPNQGYYKVIIDDYFADDKDLTPCHFFELDGNYFRVRVIEPTNGVLVDDIFMEL